MGMKNRRNYYRILHVQPDAPDAIIRASYRTLMQKLKAHPDLGGDDWNAALINEAFAVVMDPVRRALYDTELRFQAAQRDPDPVIKAGEPPPAGAPVRVAGPQKTCPFCRTLQQPLAPCGPEDLCPGCRSPLQPAVRVELEGSCKRAVSRIAREGAIRIFTQWPQAHPYPGVIVNLSPNGSRIAAPLALAAGTLIKMEGDLLSAVARVVSCLEMAHGADRRFHLGTEFLTLAFTQMRGTFVSARI